MLRELQVTCTSSRTLFWWSVSGEVRGALQRDAPELLSVPAASAVRHLASPDRKDQRRRTRGLEMTVADALPVLAALEPDAPVSDSVRCLSLASKLALELAARQRVIPSVQEGEARWKALVTRQQDLLRFQHLVEGLPVVARALPTAEQGRRPIRLRPAAHTLRTFLDDAVDALYRSDAWPGSARGWALELAEALRGDSPAFSPRDARHQAVPEQLAAWSSAAGGSGLRLGLSVSLPEGDHDRFEVHAFLYPLGSPDVRVPMETAWDAGASLVLNGRTFAHPADVVVRGLARAARLHPPLNALLAGPRPKRQTFGPQGIWSLLSEGLEPLRAAGVEVTLPEAFARVGNRRLRARMRIGGNLDPAAGVDLSTALAFQWEVALGDQVLTSAELSELTRKGQPIVRFRNEWVLLDPRELARLPRSLGSAGTLPAAVALRAVLVGEHEGVPVVADDRLSLVIEALRSPPKLPIPRALDATLRPYQEAGFAWLGTMGALGLGCCLADDMGLGKTIQLITYLLHRKRERRGRREALPSLVICPTSVLGNWQREIARFAPSLRVHRHHGLTRSDEEWSKADVVITTYGLLTRDDELLQAQRWDVLILDEAQAIKNPDSRRAGIARTLRARHRVALTGTPVENRLQELWSLMEFLVAGLLGPRAAFQRNVAVPIERFGDEDLAQKLRQGVAPFLLRRVKTDPNVIDDLPEKIERSDYTPLTTEQAALYRQVTEDAFEDLQLLESNARRGRVLAMLTALKQVCNHPEHYLKGNGPLHGRSGKLDRCAELVDSVVELRERALIFTQYREMGVLLQDHLGELLEEPIPFLHGGTPAHHRDEMVSKFQEDPDACPILIISLRAGGTGLNLTAASHVIHFDRWWNPAVEDQATDRAYRIGQHRNVQVHKLVCEGTLEERIDELLTSKRALAESIVGVGEQWVTELDDDALRQLVMLSDDATVEE